MLQNASAASSSPESSVAPLQGQGAQEALQAVVKDQEYFCAVLPGGQRLVHIIARGVRHPLSFGRDAAAALAGVPDRADWKVCQVSAQFVHGWRRCGSRLQACCMCLKI